MYAHISAEKRGLKDLLAGGMSVNDTGNCQIYFVFVVIL